MSLIIAFILLALLLFFFEIFVPGGILATIGVLALVAAAVLAHGDYGLLGSGLILTGAVLAGVALFFVEIRLLQRTALGRQLSLQSEIAGKANVEVAENLTGKSGVTLTRLAPSGTVQVDGRAYTASCKSSYLPAGTPVRVIRVDPFNIIVEKL